MKLRIITGSLCGIAAILVMTLLPVWVTRVCIMVFCVIGMHELLNAVGLKKHRSLLLLSLLFAAGAPFLDRLNDPILVLGAVVLFVLLVTLIQLLYNEELPFDKTAFVLCTSLVVILPIAALSYLIALPVHGRAYIFLALIIAWLADIGAYFVGTFFGKHKLCPKISPKKTVEGMIGGMISSVIFSMVGALIYQKLVLDTVGLQVVYWQVILVALILSPLSVVGDLLCSVIKRQRGLKDFGTLFPGHGGVLDRFDSLIFVAPLMYIICTYIPMIV